MDGHSGARKTFREVSSRPVLAYRVSPRSVMGCGARDSRGGRIFRRTLVSISVVASLLVLASSSLPAAGAAETGAEGETSGNLSVVGQVPLFEPGSSNQGGNHNFDGWLILNPRTRRGYQVFRLNSAGNNGTVLWSFDLDTLQPLRRAVITNFQVIQTGNPQAPGDVVNAVDEEGGRIFLAGQPAGFPGEMQVAVIDEEKIDQGLPDTGFVVRRLAVPPSQRVQILTGGPITFSPSRTPDGGALRGMAFSRASGTPKLLLLFGTANTPSGVNNHWLAQWDPERSGEEYGDWIVRVAACERNHLVPYQGWKYQLEILRETSAVSIGCTGTSGAQVVRFPLLAAHGTEDSEGAPDESFFEVFPLPRQLSNVLADPGSERLLFQVQLAGTTWWAFDARARAWVGGAGENPATANGVDPATGRLYSLRPDTAQQGAGDQPPQAFQGGFQYLDTRLTPVPQFTNVIPSVAYPGQFRIRVDPEGPSKASHVFVRRGLNTVARGPTFPNTIDEPKPVEDSYLVIEDTVPVAVQPPFFQDLDKNTTNVAEENGITGAKFDTVGSGFGFRSLLVGGITPAISRELAFALPAACYENDREAVIGQVESARLSDLSASASSLSLSADESTKADLGSPSSRCWPGTFGLNLPTSTAQAIDSAVGERLKWDSDGDGKDDYTAQCTGDDGKVDAPTPQTIGQAYSSWAECNQSDDSVKGFSSGRLTVGGDAAPVSVMHATSHVIARRSEDGGTVVEVEAIARGIEFAGVGTIGLVRTVASARSAGRPKTAETSFDRFICGVDLPGLKITSCLTDDQQKEFVTRLNQLLVRMNGRASLRNPDPELEKGSDGGYLAAIQRDRREALDDKMVTRDFSETVPGLEVIFYRGDSPTQGMGRQVFQFAAVQASSAYGIFCLFGESPNNGEEEPSCVRPTSELKVQLTDDFEENPTPLPGGVFQIHLDEDGDGILGVDDAVLELGDEEAVCTTTDDGVGDCLFELPPGNYIVHQVEAPEGFAPSPDCAVFLPAFTSMTCDFVNSPNIGLIYVGLTDDSPEANPLSGGVFELYVDDGDQKLGKGDTKLASCTTDVFGDCVFKLSDVMGKALPIYCTGSPAESEELQELIEIECIFDPEKGGNILAVELGTFIVHQTVAPPEYTVAEDQVLQLVNPWDIGIASFVNGLAPVEGTPPIEGTPSRQSTVVIEEGSTPRAPVKQSAPRQEPQSPKIITRIVTAPSEAIGFLLRHPKQAAMFASIWLLLVAPLWLVWRRRSISTLKGAA